MDVNEIFDCITHLSVHVFAAALDEAIFRTQLALEGSFGALELFDIERQSR